MTMPAWAGQAKKLFKKLGLEVHKFKPVGHNARYMFVNFANEDDRSKAIEKLNGFKIKVRTSKDFFYHTPAISFDGSQIWGNSRIVIAYKIH